MKQYLMIISMFILSCLLPYTSMSQVLYNDVGYIPDSCQIDWTHAGLLTDTPTIPGNVFDVTDLGADNTGTNSSYNAVMDAIDSANTRSGFTAIYFPAGTYKIDNTIELTQSDSNIVFLGAGADSTTLEFTVGNANKEFLIHGWLYNPVYDVNNNIDKGSTGIEVTNLSTNFNEGDWIQYYENTFPGLTDYEGDPITSQDWVGQITQLTNINNNLGTMKDEASKHYNTNYNLKVRKITPVRNIGIEKMKLKRLDAGYVNENSNIVFECAVNCWIKGIESDNAASSHIYMDYCSHIEVSGSYIHDTNYGGGKGNGYGIVPGAGSTNCLIENNIFHDLRHSIIFTMSANTNVASYNFSFDSSIDCINFHGRYVFANLIEQNYVEIIEADDTHGINGPYNAYLRNNGWRLWLTLWHCPNTSVLGCNFDSDVVLGNYPIQPEGSTTIAKDMYGKIVDPGGPLDGTVVNHTAYEYNRLC